MIYMIHTKKGGETSENGTVVDSTPCAAEGEARRLTDAGLYSQRVHSELAGKGTKQGTERTVSDGQYLPQNETSPRRHRSADH